MAGVSGLVARVYHEITSDPQNRLDPSVQNLASAIAIRVAGLHPSPANCTLSAGQPRRSMMELLPEHDIEQTRAILERTGTHADLLLPTLLEVQRCLGHVPNSLITEIAEHFNLSRADVHGVATFYHDLRASPLGRRHVQICQAEACQAQGSRALTDHAERRLGVTLGTTRADTSLTLGAAYCLGNCACGPTVRIGDEVYGRVTAERFDELIVGDSSAEPRT